MTKYLLTLPEILELINDNKDDRAFHEVEGDTTHLQIELELELKDKEHD